MPPAGCTSVLTSHIYSHCVGIHFAAYPPSKLWPEGIAACSHAEWGQSCELADRKLGVEAIEILEAKQVGCRFPAELPLSSQLRRSSTANRCWTVRAFDRPGSEEVLRIPVHAGGRFLSWRHPKSAATESTPPKRSLNAPFQVGRPCSLEFRRTNHQALFEGPHFMVARARFCNGRPRATSLRRTCGGRKINPEVRALSTVGPPERLR